MSPSTSYVVTSCGSRRSSLVAAHEAGPTEPRKPRLLDRVRAAVRLRHYTRRTEEAYVAWIRRYIPQVGAGWVELPTALVRKYPNAGRQWVWQWVFPATRLYRDRVTGERRRHHLHESVLQRTVNDAVRRAGIAKRATPHTLRIPSPPIYSKMAATSAPFRNSSVTATWRQRRSTRTC